MTATNVAIFMPRNTPKTTQKSPFFQLFAVEDARPNSYELSMF
jgi:hypothetical protein